MSPSRRVWCSCTIIDYLKGELRAQPDCDLIIQQARQGETEILVSTLAITEVVSAAPLQPADADVMITEFFRRPYVVAVAVDIGVAERARYLRRTYPALKTVDAIHMATALHFQIEVLETFDTDLLKLDGKEGAPPLVIRPPKYIGQSTFLPGIPPTPPVS